MMGTCSPNAESGGGDLDLMIAAAERGIVESRPEVAGGGCEGGDEVLEDDGGATKRFERGM